jgi:hypothetical protein
MKLKTVTILILYLLLISCGKNKDIDDSFKSLDSSIKNVILHSYNKSKKEKQSSHKRNFKSTPELIKKFYIGDSVFNPGLMDGIDSSLYILDLSSMRINKINYMLGRVNNSFGKGKGHGPGELIRPTDMVVADHVYISDVSKGTIEIYSLSGTYLNTIKLNSCSPYKFIITKNHDIIINNELDLIFPFYKYNSEGAFLKKFGTNLILRNIKSGLFHDMKLCTVSDTSFLQLPIRLGVIGLYKNDELVLIKETIDGKQIKPDGIIYGENYVHADKLNYLYTSLFETRNDNFLILYSKKSKKGIKEGVFDVYNINTLNYLTSFKLEGNIYGISLINDKLLTLDHDSVSLWDISKIIEDNK